MKTSTQKSQAFIELSKKDLRIALVTAAVAPVLCFSAGLFTAFALNETSVPTKTEQTPIATNSISEQTTPSQVVLSTPNNHSLPAAPIEVVTTDPKGYYLIQAGVFSSFTNAKRYHQELTNNLINSEIIEGDNQTIHRVILNKFISKEAATKALVNYQHKYPMKLYISFIPYLAKTETIAAI